MDSLTHWKVTTSALHQSQRRTRRYATPPLDPLNLPELKKKREKAEARVTAEIKKQDEIAVLKAAETTLAARRRRMFQQTSRKAVGEFQRVAVRICRTVGPGNTILLPPVNYKAWYHSLNSSTTNYAQTLGLGRGINILSQISSRFGIRIAACNEVYTSQECSHCRDCVIRGSGRTFKCHVCGLVNHRDAANSATNIAIRSLALGLDIDMALRTVSGSRGAIKSTGKRRRMK